MRRYRNSFLMIFVLLGVTTVLVAAGKNQLQQQVAALEAEVAELRAESDGRPVVIDANGVEVGTVVELEVRGKRGNEGTVMIDLPGAPLFTLYVTRNGLVG